MRTIIGRVRPFGQGTKPVFVRFEWPETLEEVEEISDRIEGDEAEGVLILGAKKAMIAVQDHVRSSDTWEGRTAPDEEDEQAWGEIQAEVNSMVEGTVIDPGTYPGETKSQKSDPLDEARQDPERAEELIEELRSRHGL